MTRSDPLTFLGGVHLVEVGIHQSHKRASVQASRQAVLGGNDCKPLMSDGEIAELAGKIVEDRSRDEGRQDRGGQEAKHPRQGVCHKLRRVRHREQPKHCAHGCSNNRDQDDPGVPTR